MDFITRYHKISLDITSFTGFFNWNEDAGSFDDRSDDKGAEPEALTVGEIDGRTIAFVGLERQGGIMMYDITGMVKPKFLGYFTITIYSN